ncbi:hypothetical protein NEILACOT_05372 [Neisseria lactamica ATCC 23970]|uniref:Lipoprotein n=3 Tax=Neisseriaceae TaxID=481 RepID=D0WCT8_NEILA|nr:MULTISPECIES: hypothetical protein [Neisseria]EEZ74598.1 hypothetical protein NEILACOT_05372 [Neisseria lactamica ATCC 23970]SUA16588.1 Uncharacterised protein [Neisseria lactamica]VTQ49504.1 Uncharacterised protein [Neisseria lactamica]
MKKSIYLLPLVSLLTACGGEPSNSDIKGVLAETLAQMNHYSTGNPMAGEMLEKIQSNLSVSKAGSCVKDDTEGKRFECPISYEVGEYEINGMKVPAYTGSTTIVLVRTDSGWTAH